MIGLCHGICQDCKGRMLLGDRDDSSETVPVRLATETIDGLLFQEICRDIRKLDHAKSNLTATITAFRRLSMLVTAVGEASSWPPALHNSYR